MHGDDNQMIDQRNPNSDSRRWIIGGADRGRRVCRTVSRPKTPPRGSRIGHGDWNELFSIDETFQRFPEFD